MTDNPNELPWDEKIPAISINPDMATRDDIARMAAELMELREERDKLLELTKIVLDDAETHHKAGCEAADWYNNNVSCVGQSTDYMQKPRYPSWYKELREAVESIKCKCGSTNTEQISGGGYSPGNGERGEIDSDGEFQCKDCGRTWWE
jgi:hypothetical protein